MRRCFVVIFAVAMIVLAVQGAHAQGVPGETTPVDQISDFAMWSAIAGFLGTWVMAGINRARWSSVTKFAMYFGWCILAAAITSAVKRELDLDNWSRSLLIVFAAGQATYLAGKSAIKQVEVSTG